MKLTLTSLLFFFATCLFCQEDTTPKKNQKEFGIDALFINRFLPLERTIGITSPYLFNYRNLYENGKFRRMGLDIDLSGLFENNESEPGKNTAKLDVDYRIGWGKQRKIYSKLNILYGTDLLLEFFIDHTNVPESTEGMKDGNSRTATNYLTGGGPFIGFQYNFTEQFGLFTESSFYFHIFYRVEKFDDEANDFADFTDKAFGFNRRFSTPGNLVLFYKF